MSPIRGFDAERLGVLSVEETDAGLLSVLVSKGPRIRVREEKQPGTNVVLDYVHPELGRQKETLAFGVRDARGKLSRDDLRRAIEEAKNKAAEIRLNLQPKGDPRELTNAGAWALYFDEKRGGLPEGVGSVIRLKRHRELWLAELDAERPFGATTPAQVEAVAKRYRRAGKLAEGEGAVKSLGIVARWLDKYGGYEDVFKDPTRHFDKKKYFEGYEPKRPRFSDEQIDLLWETASRVEPRLALLIALEDDSGSRAGQLRRLMRADWNRRLDNPPTTEQAPNGYLWLRGVKGQKSAPLFLTDHQLAELSHATTEGYLSLLEGAYQRRELEDYPLFPGAYLRAGKIPLGVPLQPTERSTPSLWFRAVETEAGIKHVPGLGLHGIRRRWVDRTAPAIGADAAARAGGWSKRETMTGIYQEQEGYDDRARAREAQESRRRGKDA